MGDTGPVDLLRTRKMPHSDIIIVIMLTWFPPSILIYTSDLVLHLSISILLLQLSFIHTPLEPIEILYNIVQLTRERSVQISQHAEWYIICCIVYFHWPHWLNLCLRKNRINKICAGLFVSLIVIRVRLSYNLHTIGNRFHIQLLFYLLKDSKSIPFSSHSYLWYQKKITKNENNVNSLNRSTLGCIWNPLYSL